MTVRTASGDSGASGDTRGMGEEKSSPCTELRKKRKLRKRKRKRAGHGRRKKIPHAPNRDKRGSQGREKGKERGMGEEKSIPCPELR